MSRKLRDELVTIDHAVTMARQGFKHILEKRLVWAAIARTSPDTWDTQFQRHSVELNIRELAETFPAINRNDLYGDIRKILRTLLTRGFQIETPLPGGHYFWQGRTWLNGADYHSGNGTIRLTFTPESSQLLENLKAGKFDQYLLKEAAGFDTLKSWRLFELLESWRNKPFYEISVDDFVSICEVNPNYLTNFAELNRTIIQPCIEEINKFHDWNLKLIPKKEGRKVVTLRFEFGIKKTVPKARKEAGPQPSSLPLPELGPEQPTAVGKAASEELHRLLPGMKHHKLT